jgi:hypothetical protein
MIVGPSVAVTPKSWLATSRESPEARGHSSGDTKSGQQRQSRSTIHRTSARASAKRHANSNLACAALQAIGDHTVEAHRRQQKSKATEEAGKSGDQTLLWEVLVYPFRKEPDFDGQVLVQSAHLLADGRSYAGGAGRSRLPPRGPR